jgi:hypothetical protein
MCIRDSPSVLTHPELREALLLVSGGRQPTARSLGSWLRRRKGRVVGGKRFVMLPQDRNGISRWQVVTGEAGLAVDDLVEDIPM